MGRKKIVAGNWKMNMNYAEGVDLAKKISKKCKKHGDDLLILCPPFIHTAIAYACIHEIPHISLGGQNCHQETGGAYTGEISAGMLRSAGCEYVIIGHSERRQYYNESDELLSNKTRAALNSGLSPIFCCGEVLDQRESGQHFEIVSSQLKKGLFEHFNTDEFSRIVIAYEPVWAIGTGKTATPEQAQEMHAHIRQLTREHYGKNAAESLSILYGGSCKPSNAAELFSNKDVDGGLIGGASLNADDFIAIYQAL